MFSARRRRGRTAEARAPRGEQAANYRRAVLTAHRDVEDGVRRDAAPASMTAPALEHVRTFGTGQGWYLHPQATRVTYSNQDLARIQSVRKRRPTLYSAGSYVRAIDVAR